MAVAAGENKRTGPHSSMPLYVDAAGNEVRLARAVEPFVQITRSLYILAGPCSARGLAYMSFASVCSSTIENQAWNAQAGAYYDCTARGVRCAGATSAGRPSLARST